jgi:hypothetical protein
MRVRDSEMVRLIAAALPHTTFSVLGRIPHSAAEYKQRYHAPDHSTRSYYENVVTVSPRADYLYTLSISLRRAMSEYVGPSDEFASSLPAVVGAGTGTQTLAAFLDRVMVSAALFGVARTVHSLFRWIDGEPASYMDVFGIKGLSLDNENTVEWCDGVRFVKIPSRDDELDGLIPDHLRHEFRPSGYDRTRPDVLLCCDATARPVFDHPANIPGGKSRPAILTSSALPANGSWADLLDALSLACDSCVYDTRWWRQVNDGVTRVLFLHGSSSRPMGIRGDMGYSAEFTPAHLQRALALVSHIKRCDRAMRTCIHRWKMSFVRLPIERLIDLRIALEALYAQGALGETKLRVSVRGAWHLGTDAEERRTILDKLSTFYDDASRVVHGSEPRNAPRNSTDCDEVRSYCRRGILKVLAEGAPDWKSLIVGA